MARGRKQPEPVEELAASIDRARDLIFALLFDVAAWLAGDAGPVAGEVPEYRVSHATRLVRPADRLAKYVSADLLFIWSPLIEGWLASGRGFEPDFGLVEGLSVEMGEGQQAQALARFPNHSVVIDAEGRHLYGGDWVLRVWFDPGIERITNAILRPLAQGS